MTDTPWLDRLIEDGGDIGQQGGKALEKGRLYKVAGIWHALAINQHQTVAGRAHRDDRDAGFNCVIPYGSWKGGDVLLWELRLRVELQKGQALFVRGSVITHSAWNMEGTRNSIDLFTHNNVLQIDMEKRRHGRPESKKMEKDLEHKVEQRRKRKYKKLQQDEENEREKKKQAVAGSQGVVLGSKKFRLRGKADKFEVN